MTDEMRGGFGVLCVALMAFVVSLATAGGSQPLVSDAARVIAGALGLFGLGLVAAALLRKG